MSDETHNDSSGSLVDSSGTRSLDPTSDAFATKREGASENPQIASFRQQLGNFDIIREIGRGGMGVVYEATEHVLNRKVALKVLPPSALIDEMQIRRFRNEAAAAAQLVHPHIVPVFSVGSDRGVHFYAMQLIHGQNISQVIESIRESQGSDIKKTSQRIGEPPGPTVRDKRESTTRPDEADNSPRASSHRTLIEDEYAEAAVERRRSQPSRRLFKTIAALGRDAANAISYAHMNGIIHRDIKPHNLLLDDQGKIWIADFGLAQIKDNPVGTGARDILGTLRYMSPEQASGQKFLVDHRTDVYSLGITLYELLSLRPAHNGRGAREIMRQVSFEDPIPLSQIDSRIPSELETIISKSISKNPQERYGTAEEMSEDLRRFVNDQPISARPPTALQRCRRWIAKHQTLTGMIGMGMFIIFLTSIGWSAVIWEALLAVDKQREAAVNLLEKSEGLREIANSSLVVGENPGQALALALDASNRVTGLEVNRAIQAAWDANREIRIVLPRENITQSVTTDRNRPLVLSTVSWESYGKGDYPAIVTDLKTGLEVVRFGSGEVITSAVFSPNGQYVLTSASGVHPRQKLKLESGLVKAAALWEASSGKRLSSFSSHFLTEVRLEMFSPDSLLVVFPGPNNEAEVYDTATQSRSFVLRGHTNPVSHAAFSPNGKLIATADSQGEIRLFDAKDGEPISSSPTTNSRPTNQILFSSNSNYLIASGDGGSRSYDIANMNATPIVWREPNVVIAPRQIRAACLIEKRVNLRDLVTGESLWEIETPNAVISAVFWGNGEHLAVANGPQVNVYDGGTGQSLFELRGHTEQLLSIAVDSRDNLVTSAMDSTVRTWKSESGATSQEFDLLADGRGASGTLFSPQSTHLLMPSTMRMQTTIFDADGKRIHDSIDGEILSETFDSNQIPVVNASTVSIVDPDTSRVLRSRVFRNALIREIKGLPKTNNVVVMVDGSSTVLWNTKTGAIVPLTKDGDYAIAIDVAKDSSQFLIGTANGRCQLHDSESGKQVRVIPHASMVGCVRFIPDQKRLVTIDDGGTLRFWNENNESPERVLANDSIRYNDCYPSADSRYLLTFHRWQAEPIGCWSIETGELIRQTPSGLQLDVAMHSEKPVFAFGSPNNGLMAWDFEADTLTTLSTNRILQVCLVGDRVFSVEMPPETSLAGADLFWEPRNANTIIRVCSIENGEMVAEIKATNGMHRNWLCVDHTKKQVAVSTALCSASISDIRSPHSLRKFGKHTAPISFCGFLGDSKRVATASWDGSTVIWGEEFQRQFLLGEGSQPITAGAISRDGKLLACGHLDGSIVLWNTSNGQSKTALKSASQIIGLGFDSGGKNLLSVERAGGIRYWSLQSEQPSDSKELTVAAGAALPIVSFDDRYALIAPVDPAFMVREAGLPASKVILCDLQSNKIISTFNGARAAAFSNTSNRFALVMSDGWLKYYSVGNEGNTNLEKELKPNSDMFFKVAFAPNDDIVATLGKNNISLWKTTNWEEFHRFKVSQSTSRNLGNPFTVEMWHPFSNDGRWIGFSNGMTTQIRALSPVAQAKEADVRTLLPSERSLFGIDLANQILTP